VNHIKKGILQCMKRTIKIIFTSIIPAIAVLFFVSCKNQKKKDMSELNEIFGYQTSVEKQENDTIKKIHNDPNVYDYYLFDLDNDSKKDSIILLDKAENYEPGVFHTIIIKFSNGNKFKHGSNVTFDKTDIKIVNFEKNLIQSEYLKIIKHKGVYFLMMSGYKADCCPRNLSIIKIVGSKALLSFNKGFDISHIEDTDNDGILEITGRTQYTQIFEPLPDQNAELGTYAPFEVFLIKDNAEYAYGKSKEYNEKNYIWAGEKASASIHVIYPNDFGKPFLKEK